MTPESVDRRIREPLVAEMRKALLGFYGANPRNSADYGRIVTIASVLGLKGSAYVAGYNASKHGAVGLTRAHVRFMLDRLAALPDAAGLVPRDADTLHPLASALRVEPALARARALLEGDRRRLMELVEGWPTIDAASLPEPSVLSPCNEPGQWQAWLDR